MSAANRPADGSPDRSPDRPPARSVALDVSAVPASPAGAGRYIVELARALGRREGPLTLVTARGDSDRWREIAPASRIVSLVPAARPIRLAYERTGLARAVDALPAPAIEVYHGPHYTMPGRVRGARVVTVHDVTFLEHPEWHERSKVPFFRSAIRRAAADADAIVCVSRATADRLQQLLDVIPPVVVAPHGVDHERFSPGPVSPEDLPAGLRSGELIVHVGTLEPRKGVVDLIDAFDRLATERPAARLVLAGTPGWGAAAVERAVSGAQHRDRIHRLGWVPDDTLVALLRAASVVAYPSHEEGFGLPALEAMAVGARLVTTRGTAMAEFAGDAAWLADPGAPESLRLALEAALGADAEETHRRAALALTTARAFTWETTADRHVEAYELACDQRSARRRGGRRHRGH